MLQVISLTLQHTFATAFSTCLPRVVFAHQLSAVAASVYLVAEVRVGLASLLRSRLPGVRR